MKLARLWILASLALIGACGDDGGAAGPDAAPASCADYCAAIATNCTAGVAQYTSPDQCMAACATFPAGTPGDHTGNSLECRADRAGAALGDPAGQCEAAGPGGADQCGADCDGFCTIVMSVCTGANEAYASLAECMTACAGFADTEPYDVSDVSGDTLACRLYHAQVATLDPATHCPHTQPVSAVCN